MDKLNDLGTESIPRLLMKYSLPSIIAMIINAVYNVVDRIFIGQFSGEAALGGLTIAFPIMMLVFAFAALTGAGGSALLAISLGEKKPEKAGRIFGNTITTGVGITILISLILFLKIDDLLYIFGATDEIFVYAKDYMMIIILGFIFQTTSFILTNFVRNEGRPILAMITMMTSIILNIVLDWLFIVVFNWGVQGAALATVIGQFGGFAILLIFYLGGYSRLRLRIKYFKPVLRTIRQIFSIGFATFIGTIGTSLAMTVLNKALNHTGGAEAITSMGAINSLYTFFIMPIMGLQQGMNPIIGYNYGAELKKRVWKTLLLGILIGSIFSLAVFITIELFAVQAVSLFIDQSSPTISTAVSGLKIYILSLPVLSINFLGVAYFQSTSQAGKSLLLSILRQFVFLLPLVLILSKTAGLTGVWFATPVADVVSVLVTAAALIQSYGKERGVGAGTKYRSI